MRHINKGGIVMKKTLAMSLCLALLLVGCVGSQEPSSEIGEVVDVTATSPTIDTANESIQATEEQEDIPATHETPAISEMVILDEKGLKITAKSLDYDGWYGPELKLLIENNSEYNLTVQCRNSSVNGYMVDTLISCTVASGKKANDELTIYSSSLEMCGIETIADIEFSFHVFSSDSWERFLDSEPISIKTSAADTYNYKYDDTGDELYRENDVVFVSKGIVNDPDSPGLLVYIYNGSNNAITSQIRDLSVNGFMTDSVFSSDIAAGKHAISKIKFQKSSLAENGIEEIEIVEFYFHFYDSDEWSNRFDSDPIIITTNAVETAQEPAGGGSADTIFTVGNIEFVLVDGQEITGDSTGTVTATLTPKVSAVSVYASEIIDYLGGQYTAAFQHSAFISLDNRVSSQYSYFDLPILSQPVEFTITATTDGISWLIGTFYDEQYVYTISYGTSDTSSEESANFTDFLDRMKPVTENELQITGYTH